MKMEPIAPSGQPGLATPQRIATPVATKAVPEAEGERGGVFQSLVREDADITGLVAYSIYKQNKLDWLLAFEKACGRPPNEAEQLAYGIGESTPRRLATYRQLADATLAGDVGDPSAGGARAAQAGAWKRGATPDAAARRGAWTQAIAGSVILAVAILVGAWLVIHFTQVRA